MHSDPQDTTPQITRLLVTLTMSRLKVLSIMSIHHHFFEDICSTNCGASGRTRTCVHFVRSEGHQSSLARTLKSLVGELRIELRPRAPMARMQRITLFPVVPARASRTASLKFSAERIDRAYATGEIWWTVWELNAPDYPACKAGDHPK